MTQLLVIGAGDVGGRLARLRAAAGDEVVAVRRTAVDAPTPVRWIDADIGSDAGLRRLPKQAAAVVFCAAPDRRDEAAYRALFVTGLGRVLDHVDAPRRLLVSSTAVYGEDAGEWVDEDTPARPAAFNGRVLLEAEGLLQRGAGGVVLRLAGIYGPQRAMMLRKAARAEPGAPRWSNRVHVDDAVSALALLLRMREPGPLYLGCDDLPVLEHELLDWLRERAGLPRRGAAEAPVSGRRVRNDRLRAAGWELEHQDFRSGYGALPVAIPPA